MNKIETLGLGHYGWKLFRGFKLPGHYDSGAMNEKLLFMVG
jgi:hypothetical protein